MNKLKYIKKQVWSVIIIFVFISTLSAQNIRIDTLDILEPVFAKIPKTVKAYTPKFKENAITNIKYLDVEQGMNYSNVLSMLQDKNGNIWIGTWGGGVAKYDGESFTFYSEKDGLLNNIVWDIYQAENGDIWFGTRGGICKFDGKRFVNYSGVTQSVVTAVTIDKEDRIWFASFDGKISSIKDDVLTVYFQNDSLIKNVWELISDDNGDIWIGTDNGVFRYNGVKFIRYTQDDGLVSDTVFSIYKNSKLNILFGGTNGVVEYDGKDFIHNKDFKGFEKNSVKSILEDSKGNIWYGTGNGLIKYDGEKYFMFTENNGLSHNDIRTIIEDFSGNIWVGTYGRGINKINSDIFYYYTENDGLSNNIIRSICEDKDGLLWLSADDSRINTFDGEKFNKVTKENHLDIVWDIIQDKDDNLWFATWGKGVFKFDGKNYVNYTIKDGLSSNIVLSALEDSQGNIWFGTNRGGVNKFDGNNFIHYKLDDGLAGNIIVSMMEDSNKNLWFGSYYGGVSKYDGKDFITYSVDSGLPNNLIWSMYEDSKGYLWFGTWRGLSRFDGESFTNLTEEDGLSNNIIWSIIEDKRKNIWLGTHVGLSKLSPKLKSNDSVNSILSEYSLKTYGYTEGFSGNSCYSNSVLEDSKGNLWWGTDKSLIKYNPKFDVIDTTSPKMHIKNVQLYFKDIKWDDLIDKSLKDTITTEGIKGVTPNIKLDHTKQWYNIPVGLELSYDNNYLTFEFIGIHFRSLGKIKYQFMLDGLEKDWNPLTEKNEATYSNLPPGNYTFKVKARSSDGYWGNTENFSFIINPPWWKTYWFRVIASIFAVSILIIFVKLRERKLISDKQLLETAVKERTIALANQTQEIEEKNEELYTKNEEIISQKDEIESQRDVLSKQKDKMLKQNKELEKHKLHLEDLVRERTEDLEASKIKAEESDRLKTAFLANISHEIRTPMNAIIGFSNFLLKQTIPEVQKKKYQNYIRQSSNTLLNLINEIIDISQIESGQLYLSFSDCDVNETLIEIKDVFIEIKKNKDKDNIELLYKPDLNYSNLVINTDIMRFKQVISNLIENSLKYTEEGYIEFGFFVVNKEFVKFYIKDTGIGIEDDKIKVIFDRFRQADDEVRIKYGGVGLGLAISKNIIELLGGEIWVESTKDQGAIFYFTLPYKEGMPLKQDDLLKFIKSNKYNWENKLILIAEDNKLNFEYIREAVIEFNANVLWAKDGGEAIELCKNNSDIDLVLMDIKMPVIDGYQATVEIKSIRKELPVFAQTAYAMPEEIEKFKHVGFEKYITKPIDIDYLLSEIDKIFNRK